MSTRFPGSDNVLCRWQVCRDRLMAESARQLVAADKPTKERVRNNFPKTSTEQVCHCSAKTLSREDSQSLCVPLSLCVFALPSA